MELIGPEIAPSGPSWVARLVEALQPLSVRAHRLASIQLFTQGEALVSADARPIRVAARGDVVGGATLLTQLDSP